MEIITKQISSLEKIRNLGDIPSCGISDISLLKGESFSYQIIIANDSQVCLPSPLRAEVSLNSKLSDFITLYSVKNAVMDLPAYEDSDDDYITKTPGTMPDILIPLSKQNNLITFGGEPASIWVKIDIPNDFAFGQYKAEISLTAYNPTSPENNFSTVHTLNINIINVNLPKSRLFYSQWIHLDCIARAHNVDIYSKAHWDLIDRYVHTAAKMGINTILTPVITPPLDTAVGKKRPCIQLVKIEKNASGYSFDFSLLKKWIDLCHKNSIEYFEISSLFSQWGIERAPNIIVCENGKESYMFDEKVSARDKRYKEFLESFLPALAEFFKNEGIENNCFFHISDEPGKEHLENYKYAYNLVSNLCPGFIFRDAVSDIDFYETGLIKEPIVATDHIQLFLKKGVPNMWAYYCCAQSHDVANRFLSMPSYRNRIIGLQLYKYDIKGFLHWGYNFYFSQLSLYEINPYITTSADKAFPSGDAFSVYPGEDGPLLSLRAVIFKEALQDISLCALLESYIGKEKVVELIENTAKMELTFSEYPKNSEFIQILNSKMKRMICDIVNK